MRILLVSETLHAGGAETFIVRLANALCRDHEVILFNIHPELSKHELIQQLHANVTLYNLKIPFRTIIRKFDSLLLKLKIDFSFLNSYYIKTLQDTIRNFAPEVVHSHLFSCDFYVSQVNMDLTHRFNHVSTNHGDYLIFHDRNPARTLNYNLKRDKALARINHVVNISDEQMVWCSELKKKGVLKGDYHKILNGYTATNSAQIKRADVNIPEDGFVYGMVARGIKEKGWAALIQAFTLNALPNTWLLLIGEGPEIDELKIQFKAHPNIIFAGYSDQPLKFISLFDVGLLPSYYKAESLPTVIIEYLYCNKPVIASDIGELKNMITVPGTGEKAGELLHYNNQEIDVTELADKMKRFYLDRNLISWYSINAAKAFQKFEMAACVNSYLKVYTS